MKFFPNSTTGKLSVWLFLGAIALLLSFIVFGEWLDLIPDAVISVLGPVALVTLLTAGVLALLRLLKSDRAILLYVTVGAALLEVILLTLAFLGSD